MDILKALESETPKTATTAQNDFMSLNVFDSALYRAGVAETTRKECIEWYEPSVWGWLLCYFENKGE